MPKSIRPHSNLEQLEQGTEAETLAAAVKANDATRVSQVLERYPELKTQLNEALPGGAFGSTPLLAAVQKKNLEMIDVLLRAGADLNARSHWWAGGFGVLDNDCGLAPFLIERGAVVDANAAARLGMLDKLAELVSANPNVVHARGGDGQTPLHVAATIEIARFLLEHGADMDVCDIDHESTPAQYALRDRPEVARYLVARGCQTDILMAAALGDLALVRKHLEADSECIRTNVSEEYFPKRNPRAGGSIYIWVLGPNKTAHIIARQFGHEEVFRFLMERSPVELTLAQACEVGDKALIDSLLASQPDLIARLSENERGQIAHRARDNNREAVRLMLEAGWPVVAKGQHGGTALHWAAFHGNAAMAEIILRYSPPLELLDADFQATPLGWAIHGSEHGWHCKTGDYARMVEMLLKAGAKPSGKIAGTDAVRQVLQRYGVEERGRQAAAAKIRAE